MPHSVNRGVGSSRDQRGRLTVRGRRRAPRRLRADDANSAHAVFGSVRTIHSPAVPGSNFYIFPVEVVRFLDSGDFRVTGDPSKIDLRKLRDALDEILRSHEPIHYYYNWQRQAEPRNFFENEFRRFMTEDSPAFFPSYVRATNEMRIPTRDVRDLPMYMLMFILYRITHPEEGSRRATSYLLSYSENSSSSQEVIHDSRGRSIILNPAHISVEKLKDIYLSMIKGFASLLPRQYNGQDDQGVDNDILWNGSESSGTRIRLLGYVAREWVRVKLHTTPAHSQQHAGKWTQEIDDWIVITLGPCVVSVRNKNDDKCMLYCLVIGLITKFKEGASRVFGTSVVMIDDYEIYSKGSFMFRGDDPISKLVRRLASCLFPILPDGSGPDRELYEYVRDIDKKVGTMTSITGFREEFSEIEKHLIPDGYVGIDVYGIDYNINPHIYPLYISHQRERVVELLCVTPPNSDTSHYCLVMNSEALLKKSGGKQFFSCSKCGACFYHRRLLNDHRCPYRARINEVPGEGGYHYSVSYASPQVDMIVGSCPKCRLAFIDDFHADYHKDHCLMKGITGYRHVQLVSYGEDAHPTMDGVAIDMEAEDRHVLQRRIMYADFESSIDPETGAHTFMSYGIYEWQEQIYQRGFDLDDFFSFILDNAYSHSEEHIYVYFHNAMGYDANFILRHVLQKPEYSAWGIQVIMKSMNRLQKLIFFTHRGDESRIVHICDSFLFLTLSLERIVDSIRKSSLEENLDLFPSFFDVFKSLYPDVEEREIDSILKKNIFPYKFFTDSSKLDTPIEQFLEIFVARDENLKYFSERVTIEDLEVGYRDTLHVVDTFGLKSARDYHDLYLCCDVMQLADVFNRSMEILWESHHIHLTKYIGMPSASWAAFLRHDPEMKVPLYEDTFYAEFFKDMIRGGITSAALRHAVADENHSIIYLDVNGLYPYVMQRYGFPCGRFGFVPMGWTGELCSIKLREYFDKFEREKKGMCFCVDLHFPDAVKELTDMYPFAPEHRRIYREYYSDVEKKELTPFLQKWSDANDGEAMGEFNGLVCTLYDKTKYNVHWRLLKFYMDHGVEVRKVWFGVSFDEGDYLAGYIRKNIEIRNTRKDELGKTLYKLLGNSVYGKTFESPFKRNTYEIVRDKVKLQGLLEEGNIAAMTPIDDMGWIVRMDGEDIVLDKPTYIGACVCEFSKLHMYTLLYDKLMNLFPNVDGEKGCQMVYTDTDSFIVRVRHPPGVTSNPETLFGYIKSRDPDLIGGIGGQVKSETGEDDTIQEVIALRSKVYAYKTWHGHFGKRAKGTTHDAQEMQLDWDIYKRALDSLVSVDTRNVQFVRETFKISSIDVFRRSLSVNDGKRYICEDGIHTHAFGHPSITST